MKLLRNISLLLLFISLSTDLFAQEKKPIELHFSRGATTFNPSTGAMTQSPGKYRFRLEGEDQFRTLGSGGNNLRPYLADCPEAIKYLDTYKGTQTTAITIGFLSILSFGVFVGINVNNLRAGKEGTSGIPFLGLAAVGGLATPLFISGANSNVKLAVDAYNKNLEKPQSYIPSFQPSFEQHYTSDTPLGITISIPIR